MRIYQTKEDIEQRLPEEHPFSGWVPVLGEGDDNPELVVVKKAPNSVDAQKNRPLLGFDGIPVRRALLKRGVPYYATNAVPFFKPGVNIVKRHAEASASVMQHELDQVPARKVLLLGANAARWTPQFGIPFRRVSEVMGRNLDSNGYTFRVVHSSSQFARDPGLYNEFLRGVEELLNPDAALTPEVLDESYRVIKNVLQARRVLDALPTRFSVDLETTGLNPYHDKILTIQVSPEEGIGYAFPFDLLAPEEWASYLAWGKLVGQNAQFDLKFLAQVGIYLEVAEDVLLMHSLVDETPGTHSMDHMSHRYLGIDKWGDTVDYNELRHGLRDNVRPVPGVTDEQATQELVTVGQYGARDTDITLRLANVFKPKVESRYINTLLHDAQNSLIRSELRGIRIDRDKAHEFQLEIERALHDRAEKLADEHGLENPNSTKQVAALLYDYYGIPVQTNKGRVTTAGPHIEQFAQDYPVIRDILEYRHLTKAASTYIKNILEQSPDGRYHPSFRLAATETGRLAEPLIAVIPRAETRDTDDLGKHYQYRLRELFIPDPGMVMIGADYSQLEWRMVAYRSNDPQMIRDINDDIDPHSVNAINAFNLPIPLEPYATLKKRVAATNDYERSLAKIATFASLYGGSARAIALQAGIDIDIAQAIIDALYSRYPRLAEWQDEQRHKARTVGYVETPWGRRRHFLFGAGMDFRAEEDQLREAINFEIQGHSTDMNLAAFTRIERLGIQTLFPLHDAIYAQAPHEEAEQAMTIIKTKMESIIEAPIVFAADVKSGPNWAHL